MGSHTRNVLTVKSIASSKSKKLRDGGGLWLVEKGGARYWIYDYTHNGKRRQLGLGPLLSVGLAEARARAEEARKLVRAGVDPIEQRKAVEKKPMTFGEYADAFVNAAVKAGRWRGAKTEARWRNLVENHAAALRPKAINAIGVPDVLEALRPLWGLKQESAEKLREAIERVLDAAKVEGHRSGENPAAWKGTLEHVLHKPNVLVKKKHHPAMPHADVAAFMTRLRETKGVEARALELCVLTAARSGEVRGAAWPEIDLKAKLWTIPAIRTKPGKEHRVPLSDQAVTLLKGMLKQRLNDLVFPSVRDGKKLSDATLGTALKAAGGDGSVTHGFRSSFRDYATEIAHAPREIAEAALGHAVGDAVERSYARSDALERRRALMQDWADYLDRVG
ncbi:tyrosine-type recombinase/integrase [Shinella sumterensis]|uniref:Tyrosine-type recombinase/integrase n=1 Tax=Shinella sumterensis TaxID=1967501 RepID=A0AA50H6M5_9HYPH|nr:site-specific integrase [Shinella sumterensis]WLR98613.1 tyrosine-type recombinase/integrase [Shinella sumterensis]